MDEYEEDHRAARGASCFNDDPEFIRSSFRNHFAPDHGQNNLGIRIVLAPSVESTPWH
jgi:formylglycine-generating enzyme required for sulfatase activity